MENTAYYTLQLRLVASELEVVAHPLTHGTPFHGRFAQWEPVFNTLCSHMNSSAFHRKAIQRTLSAGLLAHLIDRQTGSRYNFSAHDLAGLSLEPKLDDLDTAA